MDNRGSATGASHVCCWGRCVMGPDRKTALVSLLMIIIPCGFYQGFTSPWLVKYYGPAMPIVSIVFLCVTIFFFIITAVRDPGIIPRQENPLHVQDPSTGEARQKLPLRHHDIVMNGYPIRIKFCSTCNLYRPPRSVHCAVCDNCVERFDHHCPWIGNCIGRRNYKYFISFVISCSLLCVFTFGTSILKIVRNCVELNSETGHVFTKLWGKCAESIVLAIYTFIMAWFLIALLAYHVFLIFTNQTTYEQIKSFFYDSSPWNRGIIGNLADWCFLSSSGRHFDGKQTGFSNIEIPSHVELASEYSVPPPSPPLSSLDNPRSSTRNNNDLSSDSNNSGSLEMVHTKHNMRNVFQDKNFEQTSRFSPNPDIETASRSSLYEHKVDECEHPDARKAIMTECKAHSCEFDLLSDSMPDTLYTWLSAETNKRIQETKGGVQVSFVSIE